MEIINISINLEMELDKHKESFESLQIQMGVKKYSQMKKKNIKISKRFPGLVGTTVERGAGEIPGRASEPGAFLISGAQGDE